jgi:hypothetical protein
MAVGIYSPPEAENLLPAKTRLSLCCR